MYYYQEMPVKDIAAALGASESAVKSRLLYGRRKIEAQVRDWRRRGPSSTVWRPFPSCCGFWGSRMPRRPSCPTLRSSRTCWQVPHRPARLVLGLPPSGPGRHPKAERLRPLEPRPLQAALGRLRWD